MNLRAQIQPIAFWQESATALVIDLVQIKQFNETGSATIVWRLANDKDETMKSGTLFLTSEEYTPWGSDDNYILQVTATKLGLTIVTPPPVDPTVSDASPVDPTVSDTPV